MCCFFVGKEKSWWKSLDESPLLQLDEFVEFRKPLPPVPALAMSPPAAPPTAAPAPGPPSGAVPAGSHVLLPMFAVLLLLLKLCT